MAPKIHGRLGVSALPAATDVAVYQVPAGRKATITVSMCNRSTSTTVRMALVNGNAAALANTDYLEYETPLGDNGVLERDRITLAALQSIVMRAASANVSAVVWGVEEDA
jgi:hypothetical protein